MLHSPNLQTPQTYLSYNQQPPNITTLILIIILIITIITIVTIVIVILPP